MEPIKLQLNQIVLQPASHTQDRRLRFIPSKGKYYQKSQTTRKREGKRGEETGKEEREEVEGREC